MQTIAQPDKREERLMVACRLPKSLDRAIEAEAHTRDIPKAQVIEEALRTYLGMVEPSDQSAA